MESFGKREESSIQHGRTRLLFGRLWRLGITDERLPAMVALVLCPLITFYLFEMYTHNPFATMSLRAQLLNMAFYELLAMLLLAVTKRARAAMMLESGFFMVVGLINYYVVSFRSEPIQPWDLLSLSTAASVADNYSYALDWQRALVLIGFLALLAIESRFARKTFGHLSRRLIVAGGCVLALIGYTNLVQNDDFVAKLRLYDKLFTPSVMNKRDGNVVAFLMEAEYLNVEKPDGYSADETGQQYETLSNGKELAAAIADPASVHRPNIIVIMDEAFSDLTVRGTFATNEDYMPFIHSLQEGAENTQTGTLNVSVLGGNTANTEFEFLTGDTIAFLPTGSVAYQQYIDSKVPSLASYLKELGYQTTAIHPYNASGWERDSVYPLLGFDTFLSKADFVSPKRLRSYISDESSFRKIIELYEEKEEGEPMFVFNVTMQNHSGYEEEFDNFTPEISLQDIDSTALTNYLSLIKRTDEALQMLIEYFEEAKEDTIIVFFGDHQPTTYVSNPIVRANGQDPNALTEEENLLKYKVPYVIWSNFDIEEESGGETSANYLMIDLLEDAGLPLPALQQELASLREDYPVISAAAIRRADGGLTTLEEAEEDLSAYRSMEYYLLFDRE